MLLLSNLAPNDECFLGRKPYSRGGFPVDVTVPTSRPQWDSISATENKAIVARQSYSTTCWCLALPDKYL